MGLLLLLAVGALFWAWASGRLLKEHVPMLLSVATGAAGLWLLTHGQWAGALAAAAVSLAGWRGFRRFSRANTLDEAEARAILGVGPSANRDEIRAAHRRLVAQLHPDRGGSTELTRRVNLARDRLIRR